MRLPLQTRTAQAPDGRRYIVSIRWLGWSPRLRRNRSDGIDSANSWFDGDLGDDLGTFIVIGFVFVVVVLGAIFLFPLVAFLVQFLIAVALVLATISLGVLGVTRMTVEVHDDDSEHVLHVERARGIVAVESRMRGVEAEIASGTFPIPAPPGIAPVALPGTEPEVAPVDR